MYAIGSGWNAWPTTIHGAAGIALVAAAPWKSAVSRRGASRRGLRAAFPSLLLAAAVVAALLTGFAHRAGARQAGPLLVMQIHVGAALVAVVLAVWHVVARPVRPRRTDLDRRALLQGGLVAGGATVLTVALPHAGDRPTRSLERGSGDPASMPVTQWLDDSVPFIDSERWRLRVAGRRWSLAELRELEDDGGEELTAVLDCTGGWYAQQRWHGVRLDRLLAASGAPPGGRSVVLRSATGYGRRFPRSDAPHLLLATGTAGGPLSPGHGFPARLVAPARRGFWWVKWVVEIDVSDRPWWLQSPFPLT